MEAAKGFLTNNRGSVMNAVYIVAFLVVVYYLYKFLFQGSDLEITLMDTQADANKAQAFPFPKHRSDLNIATGGEYTISFWMYVSNWEYRSGLAKSVLQIMDTKAEKNVLLTTILYPNEPKLMVRVHTDAQSAGTDTDYTMNSNSDSLLSGKTGTDTMNSSSPVCDIQDIDLQRWINITVCVNGRIVDVYYDGKLNRSCILPDIPTAPDAGKQAVMIGKKGGFGGKIGGIFYAAYALTPDRIYGIYQAGPYSQGGLLGFIGDKLGINLIYKGAGGATNKISA
jgi:hypothetical protein